MNKSEFLSKLERLLWNIPKEEREEAIQYYEDYFNDAGVENEAAVIAELESPEKVAKSIRDGFLSGNGDSMEYTERGVRDGKNQNKKLPQTERNTAGNNSYTYGTATAGASQAKEKKSLETWQIVLIVVAAILLSPVRINWNDFWDSCGTYCVHTSICCCRNCLCCGWYFTDSGVTGIRFYCNRCGSVVFRRNVYLSVIDSAFNWKGNSGNGKGHQASLYKI